MPSQNQASNIRDNVQASFQIFVKDLRDEGRKRPLTVRPWATVKDVKDQLQQLLHVPPLSQRLYFGPMKELPNHRTLLDAGIYKHGQTLLLDINGGADSSSISSLQASGCSDICVKSSMLDETPKLMKRLVQQARRGFAVGLKPTLVLDGTGGTYFLHDARKVRVAVFKPADEEPFAENNPRGYVKQGADTDMSLRDGIKPGEACLREVAAFLLDHGGFSGVPMTTLVEARHPAFNTCGAMLKISEGGASMGTHSIGGNPLSFQPKTDRTPVKVGSCQEFIKAEDTMDDMSPSKLSVDQVHKIAILDIRIMNADRNAANLLIRRKPDNSLDLIPIDHGYCLRSACDVSWFDWCWLDWPHLKEPLSEKSKKYVLNLDIEKDVRLLQDRLHIGTDALDCFRASTKVLQAGVKAGLSLYEIALICCRNDNAGEIPSKFEVLTKQARELALRAMQNERWGHVTASQAIEEQLSSGKMCLGDVGRTSKNISKSISLANLPSLESGTNFLFNFCDSDEIPPTRETSTSSCSNSEKDEQADCEEWASRVVADVNMDVSYRSRSHSIVSSDSSYSGEDGPSFWHVAPGDLQNDTDDLWSSCPSPNLLSESFHSKNSDTPSTNGSYQLDRENTDTPRQSVKFSDEPVVLDTQALNQEFSSISLRPSFGLVRSRSYSAFSLCKQDIKPTKINEEQYRTCYLKFIDLLIERETISYGRQKGTKI